MIERHGESTAPTASGGATERILAACRQLSGGDDADRIERRLPRLALDVTAAGSATLAVLDERQAAFARLLTTRRDGTCVALVEQDARELLWTVHEHAAATGGPDEHDLFTARATLSDGSAADVLVAPLLDGRWLHGWQCVVTRPGEGLAADAGEALTLLIRWAGMALSNARLVEDAHVREVELVRAVRTLGAVGRIADSVTREPQIGKVLDRVVGEALALVDARFTLALLADGDELVVAAHAGPFARDIRGLRLPVGKRSVLAAALADGQPRTVDSFVRRDLLSADVDVGRADQRGLLAPMVFRGEPVGMLVAIEGLSADGAFDEEATQLLQSFAAGASSAVAGSRLIEEDRLRRTLAATEEERRRWARELHDETLQDLGVLRIGLAVALADEDADARAAMRAAADGLAEEIGRLRGLINELRPVLLDELGLEPAVRALVERTRSRGSYPIEARIDLGEDERLPRDVEVVAYRVTQEALTNVAKHAEPQRVAVTIARTARALDVTIVDDGLGFDPRTADGGAGLIGMRERVALTGGRIVIASRRGFGTRVRASLPLPR